MFGDNQTKLITIRCSCCQRWQAVRLDPDDLARHAAGAFVQVAFARRDGTPYLSAADRELIISACCGSCYSLLRPDPILYPTAYN